MKIEIEWLSDSHECETCGEAYATGAVVKIGDDTVIDMTPHSSCLSEKNYTDEDVYRAILAKLGHHLETHFGGFVR